MNGPTSHWGELAYAGPDQISQYQAEHDPPVEERTCPAAGRCVRGASAELARVLLLCSLCCYVSCRSARRP